MNCEIRIGSRVATTFGGNVINGTVTGKHGSADYYAVRIETGEVIYRYGADLTKI